MKLVHSTRRASISGPVERYAANLADAGLDVVNLHHAEWTAGLVELFHRFGVQAFAWDVQEVRHVRAALTMGVDAIYSDHVDRMVATVAEWSDGSTASYRNPRRSRGQIRTKTRPTMLDPLIAPWARASDDRSRLSPITK